MNEILATLKELQAGLNELKADVASLKAQNIRADSVSLTVEEAAAKLACGRTKVFELIKTGKLVKARGEGRKGLVSADSVEKLCRLPQTKQPRVSIPKKASKSGAELRAEVLRLLAPK